MQRMHLPRVVENLETSFLIELERMAELSIDMNHMSNRKATPFCLFLLLLINIYM